MHLVQLLLPVLARDGAAVPNSLYDDVRRELVDRFGGITTYSRAPAKGLWRSDERVDRVDDVDRDDIVVYEVMVDELDRTSWTQYRTNLEQRFAQDEVVVRAIATERL